MKSFFGSFFGALFAILFLIAAGVVGCIAVIALVSTSEKGPTVANNSLLVLDLAVPIMDAPQAFDPAQLLAGLSEDQPETQVTLRDVLRAISLAATDDKIKGIFITGNLLPISNYASKYPALKEVREALAEIQRIPQTGLRLSPVSVCASLLP